MKTYFIIFIAILVSYALYVMPCQASWLICHQPEFKGRIVDIETDQPIEGALIIAYYQKNAIGGPGGKIGSTIHAKEALTDKNGYFRISSYTTLIQPLSWCDAVTFIVFKPGYLCFGETNLESIFTGTSTEDREWFPTWNNALRYKLLHSGTVKLPKVRTFDDRFQSKLNFSVLNNFYPQLPVSKKVEQEEHLFLNSIGGKR